MTIDLHCHILPGLDDGALDLADSVAMARQADADGIELVCATPHIRHDHEVHTHELAERAAAVNAALAEEGVRARVVTGGEVAAPVAEGLTDEQLAQVALGGARGGWVLLEPAPGPLDDALDRAVVHLRERGYRSLIAHPERHLANDLPARLARLIEEGALVQATAAFFESEPTAPGMRELAALGLVNVLGSDAHSARFGRPVRLSGALERLAEVPALADHLDWIARDGPAAIVRGEHVSPPFGPAP
jgi:protein-tyrosine phosphatase